MHAWQRLGLIGGHMALMFANTVDDAMKSRKINGLPNIETALNWGEAAGVLTSEEVRKISLKPSLEDYDLLIDLRENIWCTLDCVARSVSPDERALKGLSEAMHCAFSDSRIVIQNNNFERLVDGCPGLLRKRLALAADDLIRGPEIHRLRECQRCTALFLDFGRGQGRRYCRPETCGNRAKVERFRAKHQ